MKNKDIISFFNQWKNDPRLYNDILATGCMERTRILCEDLINKGQECGFIYMPQEETKDETISCVAPLKSGKNYCFRWMRHVVPFVWDEAGKIVVLDVCLMDGPERLEEWGKHIQVNGEPVNRRNSFFNSADFLPVLAFRSKNKDPWQALKSLCPTYQPMAIIQNQVKSKWLKEQINLKPLFLKKKQR